MNSTKFQRTLRPRLWTQVALCFVVMIGILVVLPSGPAVAQGTSNPAPVQTFYLTLPEDDALAVMQAINTSGGSVPASTSPVVTYFSIAIGADGTYVYYDQWENGYDSDIANPANLYGAGNPGGTQIWGNGLAADGCAPNINGVPLACTDAADALNAGDVIIPSNSVVVPRDSATICFDAGDKIGASEWIAMARAAWATGSGTLLAFAHEMYATLEWNSAYESPVGANTPNDGSMFEYAALSIMASKNNTTVQIDANGDGAFENTQTLNEGSSYLATGISRGARVESTDEAKPIQVVLVTGDIGSNYESRDMNLLPVSTYGTSYWSPVGVDTEDSGPTRLFLYNPSTNGNIYITCARRFPYPTTVTQGPVAARGVVTLDLSSNSGAHCYASNSSGTATGEPIFGVGTVDTDGQAWDWSFTLFPDSFLTTDALVGLGLGRDPTSGTSTSENGGPLWVTPVCNTYVYVDWNDDGAADTIDLNGDGDTNDTNVDGISEVNSSNGILVTSLKSVRLFEPTLDSEPYDQSGARVWSRTASGVGYGGTPGCSLAVAWGQDPRRATAGAPGLDVGTSVPPMRQIAGTKSLALKTDVDGDGQLSPGDIATYNMTVRNTGGAEVSNVYIYDTVPANTTYVDNSTERDIGDGSGWVDIADDTSGTTFPLDVAGGVLLGDLAPGAIFYVRFDVILGDGAYGDVTNCNMAYTDSSDIERCATNLVAAYDWGDLPDSYGTSLAQNGARHSYSGLILGEWFDRELQGNPVADADGDDDSETTLPQDDDEDGIANAANGIAWFEANAAFAVEAGGGEGCLNVWMDFTNDDGDYEASTPYTSYTDGNFTNAAGGYDTATVDGTTYSEHIAVNVLVPAGTTTVPVAVPPCLNGGDTTSYYFRFRLSPTVNGTCPTAVAPTGIVEGGEVEDYLFELGTPTAVELKWFDVTGTSEAITLGWETASEVDNLGFDLYRAESADGPLARLNGSLIPSQAPGSPTGFVYSYVDDTAVAGIAYYYWLEDIDIYGRVTQHGPVSAVLMPGGQYRLFVPVVTK